VKAGCKNAGFGWYDETFCVSIAHNSSHCLSQVEAPISKVAHSQQMARKIIRYTTAPLNRHLDPVELSSRDGMHFLEPAIVHGGCKDPKPHSEPHSEADAPSASCCTLDRIAAKTVIIPTC
jgi:hypothetical protein